MCEDPLTLQGIVFRPRFSMPHIPETSDKDFAGDAGSVYYMGWSSRGRFLFKSVQSAVQQGRAVSNILRVILLRPLQFAYHRVHKTEFSLGGERYRYYCGKIDAMDSERIVELAVALRFLDARRGLSLLEVGNVISTYLPAIPHTIVDKYERGGGILNVDIVDFLPPFRFATIISISTLEHVGFDEPIREPGKAARALDNLEHLLEDNGKMLVTVPLGYNPEIDSLVKRADEKGWRVLFMRRVDSILDLWKETSLDEALTKPYGSEFRFANSLAFLFVTRD